MASEVHCCHVDKRTAARCEHAVQARLITGALTFYYKHLPQPLFLPFSCHCPSPCLPAFFLHLLFCQTLCLPLYISICLPAAIISFLYMSACFSLQGYRRFVYPPVLFSPCCPYESIFLSCKWFYLNTIYFLMCWFKGQFIVAVCPPTAPYPNYRLPHMKGIN